MNRRRRIIWMVTAATLVFFVTNVFCFAQQRTHAPLSSRALPQCHAVTLHASYLAQVTAQAGAGFLIELHNATPTPFLISLPVALSVHWYAQSGGKWVWRASSGVGGGALVDALRGAGPVFAAAEPTSLVPLEVRLIAPGETYTWLASFQQSPTLRYMPGCEHCNYPREGRYRAVLGYALLPSAYEQETPWLSCGLRSNPVDMPPVSESY